MRFFKFSIYIIWHLCTLFTNVYCNEADADDDVILSPQEIENINSFFYMSEKEDLESNLVRENSYELQTMVKSRDCKAFNEQNAKEIIFYRRMVAILLSNLVVQKVDDRVTGTLNINASSLQYKYLQDFVNGQGSINEVDRVLEDVIKQSEYTVYNYVVDAFYYFDQLLKFCRSFISVMIEYWNISIICFVVILSFLVLRKQQLSRKIIILLLFDIIFVMSYFITWWRLIQEAEIKLMATQARFTEIPISCQPDKMGMWDKIVTNVWYTDDCQKYYEAIMTNPRLQITPMFVLTHLVSSVIFEPFSQIGLYISDFVENATGKLNFLFKIPVILILYFCFGISIVLVIILMLNGHIKLGFGFFNFMIGKEKCSKKQDYIDRIYEGTSKQLKKSKQMKRITLKQDSGGGDADVDKSNEKSKDSSDCDIDVDKSNEKSEDTGGGDANVEK